ncbi:MAG: class I SAM-dependent methyltransferase [Sandaracinaceae bacterium]
MGEQADTRRLYRRARRAEDLPWHRRRPHAWVMEAANEGGPLRVLDLGCGAGVDAVALAQAGHHVTAVDRDPKAVRWTRQRADDAGVRIRVEQADVLALPADRFDLVVDLGCLHSLRGDARKRYFELLHERVAPRGQYILMHFIKRALWDVRRRGPVRARPEALERALNPWMQVRRRRTERHPGRAGLGPVSSLTLWGRRR